LRLQGARALLTGASGGIGAAIARELSAQGARVLLSARREDALAELAAELPGEAEVLPADLAEPQAPAELVARAGRVDVLVANAALPASGPLDDFTPEQIDRAIAVNLRAPVQLARALGPAMVERGSGHLIFVGSLSGKVASVGSALYSATKFGLRGLAAGMHEDLYGSGVGVTLVSPGFVSEAGMFAEAGVDLPRGVSMVSPGEVARAVVRGVQEGRREIDVAPLAMRAGVKLSELAPGPAAALQRRLGSGDIAAKLAEGQAGKR